MKIDILFIHATPAQAGVWHLHKWRLCRVPDARLRGHGAGAGAA